MASAGLVVSRGQVLTARQIAAMLGVARLRARYGNRWSFQRRTGHTSHHPYRTQTHCKRGHAFTPENTYVFHNRKTGWRVRHCRQCTRLRQGLTARPMWVELNGVRISIRVHDRWYRAQLRRLRRQMIAAHPDKGGTTRRFDQALKQLARFKASEQEWYRRVTLMPPT